MSYLYVPASLDLTSESCLQNPHPESWVMLRGKPSQHQSLCRKYKREPWMTRLSGLMFAPSTLAPIVESWIASQAATHASHSVTPEREEEKMTPDTCGPTSEESSKKSDLNGASLRMSKDTSRSDLMWSDENYQKLVIQLRRDYSARLKSAQAINEKGSLSWPTPTAMDGLRGGKADDPIDWKARSKRKAAEGINLHKPLNIAAKIWRTPQARDHKGGKRKQEGREDRQLMLTDQALHRWPTPCAFDTIDRKGMRPSRAATNRKSGYLTEEITRWPTPVVSNAHGAIDPNAPSNRDAVAKARLNGVALQASSHLDQVENGAESAQTSGQPYRLNAAFVEWLMGLPIEWTGSGRSVLPFSHWLLAMRGLLFSMKSTEVEWI